MNIKTSETNLLQNKDRESDSPRRKLHSTVVGRVMLSHDASLRKSDAASSRVAFSTSMNWEGREGHTISHLQTALRHCKLRRQGWQCKLYASVCMCVYVYAHCPETVPYKTTLKTDTGIKRRRNKLRYSKVTSYCIKAGHAEAWGSVFDVEEKEDVDEPHDGVKGTPTPRAGADVWLLRYQPEGGCEPVETWRSM